MANRHSTVLDGGTFRIQAVLPHFDSAEQLRVYIEGDGKAWATDSQPSTDPTPTIPLVSQLAEDDPSPSAYLARPCQYVMDEQCNYKVWTDQRFSAQAVESLSKALDLIKAKYQVKRFELVGYSGGGALALLLAAQRDDVASVQTLAGNLSPTVWTAHHQLSPLTASLDPNDFSEALRGIPQRHLVGIDDRVVPPSLAETYISALGSDACVEVFRVPASHEKGWEAAWRTFQGIPIRCGRE